MENARQVLRPNKKSWTGLTVFLLLFNLSYFFFFRPLGVDDNILKALYYFLLIGSIVYSRNLIFGKYNDYFSSFFKGYSLIVLVSVLSATIFWDQGPLDTFVSTIPNFSFLFYFFLVKSKLDQERIEKVIWIFVIIYIVCFYLALAVSPLRLFAGFGELDKEIDTSRGLARIRLTLIGAGPLYLAYFVSISKFKKTAKKKWILICVVLFITIVLQLGRQAIIFSFLLGLIYFLDNLSLIKKGFVVIGFCLGFWLLATVSPVISALVEKSESEYSGQKEGDENPRVGAYKFYMFDVSPNIITVLVGNGRYSLGKSTYGDYIEKFGRARGFIPSDVGYASIYLFFGVFGLYYFFKLLFLCLKAKVIPEYRYTKYYIAFMFLGNVAGSTLLGSVPLVCICVYLINISLIQRNQEKLKLNNSLIKN